MEKIKVKVVNVSGNKLPEYANFGDAGMDLRANITETVSLYPMERKLIPSGIKIQLPVGYEAQVRPRSGLALKHGITVLNAPGTIDCGFTNEVGVILINLSDTTFFIEPNDRIAQLVIAKHETAEWIEVEELDKSERGEGGFGSSGVK
jgi:dUTP pyrophosphatase